MREISEALDALRIARRALGRAAPYVRAFRDEVGPAVGFASEVFDSEVASVERALRAVDAVLEKHPPKAEAA